VLGDFENSSLRPRGWVICLPVLHDLPPLDMRRRANESLGLLLY
jgi:hypothetical protein